MRDRYICIRWTGVKKCGADSAPVLAADKRVLGTIGLRMGTSVIPPASGSVLKDCKDVFVVWLEVEDLKGGGNGG